MLNIIIVWKYYIGEESHLRSALSKFGFYGENVFKKVNNLSGGEKVRLKLFTLIQVKCNFIILDEPTNHLDVFTKENLEEALNEYKGTLLFISHDRYFINKLANKILYISNKNIIEYIGNYDYFIEHQKEIYIISFPLFLLTFLIFSIDFKYLKCYIIYAD